MRHEDGHNKYETDFFNTVFVESYGIERGGPDAFLFVSRLGRRGDARDSTTLHSAAALSAPVTGFGRAPGRRRCVLSQMETQLGAHDRQSGAGYFQLLRHA